MGGLFLLYIQEMQIMFAVIKMSLLFRCYGTAKGLSWT